MLKLLLKKIIKQLGLFIAAFLLRKNSFASCLSVSLNTAVDLLVAYFAGPLGWRLRESALLRRRQRRFTGCALVGLGAYVAVSGDEG